MSFEWNKMYHKDFAHMTLGNDVKFGFDIHKDILNGEIGLSGLIGGPCEVVDYYAAGNYYYWGWMTNEFQRYTMTYSRVPRITNISIQTSSDLSSYVTWQHEASSSCKSSHTTIVFRGNSTQPLEMFTAERNEDKFYLTDVTDVSGSQQVLIFFNRLGNHFSLPTIGNIFFTIHVSIVLLCIPLSLQHIITGKRYQPAYLATNKVGDDESTNTLRIVQERTTEMSFEWNKMYHKDFAHMTLGNDVEFGFDIHKDILNGEIGLSELIGGPCEVVDYYAAGNYYYWGWMTNEFQRYTMTYSRVPRIANVSIQTSSDLSSYVTWQHEPSSSCKSSHTTIVFRGNSTQPLEMFTAERNEDKFYLTDVTDVSGSQQVLILFNRLGNHFSLPTIGNIFFTIHVSIVLLCIPLSLQHITGKRYQPAYLATNKVGDDESTNTLRIVQERTTEMSFEWNKMYHKDFAHMTLGNDVEFGFDIHKDILNGEIGLSELIGGPCEVVDYYAAGNYYYWGWMTNEFQRYTMTYSRVPRIANVSIQTSSDLSSYVTWQHEPSSSCKSSHTTIVFRGNSTQPLEMFTAERNEDKFYLTDVTDVSGSQQVLILFNRLGNHFSLPTIGNIFFTIHVSIVLLCIRISVHNMCFCKTIKLIMHLR
ncbi:hypothetical protein KSF78_0009263 [Schistosoma japonicum]|nr:hypothetical protein KSF78_0009263 [Schistosoma japonicum]